MGLWGGGVQGPACCPLSYLLLASPASSAGGSPLVPPTMCPSSDTAHQLRTLPVTSQDTSIRRCVGTWKPPQRPAAKEQTPMWISESPCQNQSPLLPIPNANLSLPIHYHQRVKRKTKLNAFCSDRVKPRPLHMLDQHFQP